jgi:hypothetical protein
MWKPQNCLPSRFTTLPFSAVCQVLGCVLKIYTLWWAVRHWQQQGNSPNWCIGVVMMSVARVAVKTFENVTAADERNNRTEWTKEKNRTAQQYIPTRLIICMWFETRHCTNRGATRVVQRLCWIGMIRFRLVNGTEHERTKARSSFSYTQTRYMCLSERHVWSTRSFTNCSVPHYSSMWVFLGALEVNWRYN